MEIDLTLEETTLVEHARQAVAKYNGLRHSRGGIDTLYSFLLSDSGRIHDGACFESYFGQATICGERHAIANLILQESYAARIRSIVVADPVPSVQGKSTTPCGTCRQLIWTYRAPDTTVIAIQYVQERDGYSFPKLEKYSIEELFPHPPPIESPWK